MDGTDDELNSMSAAEEAPAEEAPAEEDPMGTLCQVCLKLEDHSPATHACMDCPVSKFLCDRCAKLHNVFDSTATHKLVTGEDFLKEVSAEGSNDQKESEQSDCDGEGTEDGGTDDEDRDYSSEEAGDSEDYEEYSRDEENSGDYEVNSEAEENQLVYSSDEVDDESEAEEDDNPDVDLSSPDMCEKHPKKELDLVCRYCVAVLCGTCYAVTECTVSLDKRHFCDELEVASGKKAMEMELAVGDSQATETTLRRLIGDMERVKENLSISADTTCNEIVEQCVMVEAQLAQRRDALVRCARASYEFRSKEATDALGTLREALGDITRGKSMKEKLVSSKKDIQIVSQSDAVMSLLHRSVPRRDVSTNVGKYEKGKKEGTGKLIDELMGKWEESASSRDAMGKSTPVSAPKFHMSMKVEPVSGPSACVSAAPTLHPPIQPLIQPHLAVPCTLRSDNDPNLPVSVLKLVQMTGAGPYLCTEFGLPPLYMAPTTFHLLGAVASKISDHLIFGSGQGIFSWKLNAEEPVQVHRQWCAGMCLNRPGKLLYTTTGFKKSINVFKVSGSSGDITLVNEWPVEGAENLTGICCCDDGSLLVLDAGAKKVVRTRVDVNGAAEIRSCSVANITSTPRCFVALSLLQLGVTDESGVVSFDFTNGNQLWKVPLKSPRMISVWEDHLYVSFKGGNVCMIDKAGCTKRTMMMPSNKVFYCMVHTRNGGAVGLYYNRPLIDKTKSVAESKRLTNPLVSVGGSIRNTHQDQAQLHNQLSMQAQQAQCQNLALSAALHRVNSLEHAVAHLHGVPNPQSVQVVPPRGKAQRQYKGHSQRRKGEGENGQSQKRHGARNESQEQGHRKKPDPRKGHGHQGKDGEDHQGGKARKKGPPGSKHQGQAGDGEKGQAGAGGKGQAGAGGKGQAGAGGKGQTGAGGKGQTERTRKKKQEGRVGKE